MGLPLKEIPRKVQFKFKNSFSTKSSNEIDERFPNSIERLRQSLETNWAHQINRLQMNRVSAFTSFYRRVFATA